jgi:DNA topoisomerase I
VHDEAMSPEAAAAAAGLRYVSDASPGIRRRKRGKAFAYFDTQGRSVRDSHELARIRALAIPPAYVDVWICPARDGHLQATGRDARGRKQYRYHKRWAEVRGETKFERMIEFAESLPRIRNRVEHDLALAGLGREKVLASAVKLLETTSIRVGNEEYARSNDSFGITTLREEHVTVRGSHLRFRFRGKSGKEHSIDVNDRRLARIVQRMQDLPGQELFSFLDDDGLTHSITSGDVNGYIRESAQGDFTAKDFRTWIGTVGCAEALLAAGSGLEPKERKNTLLAAIETVSQRLGNTPSVCRKAYIHPGVIEAYLAGRFVRAGKRGTRKAKDAEAFVIEFLQRTQQPRPPLERELRRSLRRARASARSKKAA